jgi:hypothetical protein
MVGFPEADPEVTVVLAMNPPTSFPEEEDSSVTSKTAPKPTPGWANASAEKLAVSVGTHITPIILSPEATPGFESKLTETFPGVTSPPVVPAISHPSRVFV